MITSDNASLDRLWLLKQNKILLLKKASGNKTKIKVTLNETNF